MNEGDQCKIFHGVFLQIFELGVLITGEPGVGKSELALELISRQHRLIADDTPELCRKDDIVYGTCPKLLQDFLEVRGLGLLNIKKMFGERAIKTQNRLHLIVKIANMNPEEIRCLDRIHGSYQNQSILGVDIPEVTLPISKGRNLAVMTEGAIRNLRLMLQGYQAFEDFIGRQQAMLDESDDTR